MKKKKKLRRGEVNALRILALHESEMYGLDMVKTSKRRRWRERLHRGTVYVWLARLEERGLVEWYLESVNPDAPKRPRRRKYSLTPAGQAVAVAYFMSN